MNPRSLLLALALPGSLLPSAAAQTPADEIADLKRQIGILLQRVETLEKQTATTPVAAPAATPAPTNTAPAGMGAPAKPGPDAAKAAKAPAAPPRVELGASGFSVTSADTNFAFRVKGYMQVDARAYLSDQVDTAYNDTFLIRRARPIFEGTTFGWLDYRLMLDFASQPSISSANNGLLQDASITARLWPALQIQAGKFKEPVGLERLQSGANLMFLERGFPSQMNPNRDVGLQVQGDLAGGLLRYETGIFNGVSDGGSSDFDVADEDKDVAGRLFARPFKAGSVGFLKELGVGVGGTYGNQEGSLRPYSTTSGYQRFFTYRSSTDATRPNVLADGERWRLSPQATYYLGSFGLLAEYTLSSQTLRQAGGGAGAGQIETLEHSGWQVALSYFLTGERNSFKPVSVARPVTFSNGSGWGAWELVARVGQLSLDPDSFPIYADPAKSAQEALAIGVGANWHLNRNLRLSLNYEHTTFDAANGNPFADEDEDIVVMRAQISF